MAERNKDNSKILLSEYENNLLPNISIDNVIFGFNEGSLKILLNKFNVNNKWMLPGGFIYKDESIDDAAHRILNERTGLEKIFLTQFHLFGNPERTNIDENKRLLTHYGIDFSDNPNHWFLRRFVSVGYYAFVKYPLVKIFCNSDEEIRWFDLSDIPELYSDHNKIVNSAVSKICKHIGNIPIGYELLPEKFTMTELRLIYEALLGEKLDRRNFQRKIIASKLLNKLEEKSKKLGIKPSSLYSFDIKKIERFLQ